MDDAAVAAVQRFTASGDTAANQELLHRIDHSLDVGGTDATQTVAPQLLRWCMQGDSTDITAATVLYVAVLNRHFCLRVVLDRLAQPLDRRPGGLAALQQLYAAAARQSVQEAARKQLTQCVACLCIVLEDHLAEQLASWIGGADATVPPAAEDSRMALHIFMATVDLLVDRRVAIGSIRRATQRRQLQAHLSIVLQSPLRGVEDMPLLVRVTATAVRFLLEAMYGEPQEVAETFWAALPTSAVWQYCVHTLSDLATPCPAEVLDLVCDVLRCLTLLDAAAETLLLQTLPAVLQPVTSSDTVDWEAISRVIAAALEASTEAIITEQTHDAPLFALFSAAAERLVQVLQAPAAPASAVNHVCEGVSALTQVLRPVPIPAMEPTDDPEDFAEIVESMEAANAVKATALDRLRPFLVACETATATRLAQSGFAVGEWGTIADYVAQRQRDREAEDFQITHDEVELALYTTYERLTRLLGPLAVSALGTAAQDTAQQLVLVTVSAELTAEWLRVVEPPALLAQAALLPCTVARYLVGANSNGSLAAWSAETSLAVMQALLRAVSFYLDHNVYDGAAGAKAVLSVAEAAVKAAAAVLAAGYHATQLQQECVPLVALLWRFATASVRGCPTSTRHAAVRHLSSLLRRGVAVLPTDAVTVLAKQDLFTQTLLFASGSVARGSSLDTLDVFAHTLRCLAQLSEDEEAAAEEAVLPSMTDRLHDHCDSGSWSADEVASLLDSWHTQYPSLALCFLRLCAALPPPLQPPLLTAGLVRFFSLPASRDVSTAALVPLLSTHTVVTVASTAATAAAFFPVLQWMLQPHPAFTIADGGRRVRALATCGRALCEGGHVAATDGVGSLVVCVARWQEFAAATALRGPASDDDDDAHAAGEDAAAANSNNDSGDLTGAEGAEDAAQVERRVLEELAVWARFVVGVTPLPSGAPDWLASLQCAQDDYERMEVLKNI